MSIRRKLPLHTIATHEEKTPLGTVYFVLRGNSEEYRLQIKHRALPKLSVYFRSFWIKISIKEKGFLFACDTLYQDVTSLQLFDLWPFFFDGHVFKKILFNLFNNHLTIQPMNQPTNQKQKGYHGPRFVAPALFLVWQKTKRAFEDPDTTNKQTYIGSFAVPSVAIIERDQRKCIYVRDNSDGSEFFCETLKQFRDVLSRFDKPTKQAN